MRARPLVARRGNHVKNGRHAGPEPTSACERGRGNPVPPRDSGPRAPRWSPAATGQRTRAAWSRDPSGVPCVPVGAAARALVNMMCAAATLAVLAELEPTDLAPVNL